MELNDQSTTVLRLLQQFLNRTCNPVDWSAKKNSQRCLILDCMRRIRQRQAQEEYEAMERGREMRKFERKADA